MTHTVRKFSSKDVERVSSVGDARRYGHSAIEVLDDAGLVVARYECRRGYGGSRDIRAEVAGLTTYSAHKRSGHRTLRAWFIDEVRSRYGVEVGR